MPLITRQATLYCLKPKRLITFFALTTLTFGLISCQKTKLSPSEANKTARKKRITKEEERQKYSLLDSTGKYRAWITHFNDVLSQDKSFFSFNESQIAYLNELVSFLRPSFFDDSKKESHQARIDYYKDYAINLFGKSNIASFLFGSTLSVSQGYTIFSDGGQDIVIVNCNCSTASDFCYGFSDCEIVKVTEKCGNTDGECGFLWRYQCNGICR